MATPWILVICHEFPPIGGGAARNLSLLCRELLKRGIGVKVLTSEPGPGNALHHPFEVAYVRTGRRKRFETRLSGMFAFLWKGMLRGSAESAGKVRDSGGPALVLSCLGIPAGLVGTWVSRRLRVPHAVWYHGSDVHGGRPCGCGTWQRLLLGFVARGAARNLFVSSGLRAMAEAATAIPGGAVLPSCPSPELIAASQGAAAESPKGVVAKGLDPAVLRTAAGGDGKDASGRGETRYFLFLGRFEPVKNPLLLLEAMARIKAQTARTPRLPRLLIVGGGALEGALRARLRVLSLSGWAALEAPAPYDQVPALLRGAYALVVPSRVEGFNTTILEAARFGVPTVGSDTVGVRDFVRHGETGLLFPEGDAAALAGALMDLAADPAMRDSLGARARAAARPFTSERVADAFLEAMAEACPALARAAPGSTSGSASASPASASPEETPACP